MNLDPRGLLALVAITGMIGAQGWCTRPSEQRALLERQRVLPCSSVHAATSVWSECIPTQTGRLLSSLPASGATEHMQEATESGRSASPFGWSP